MTNTAKVWDQMLEHREKSAVKVNLVADNAVNASLM